MKHGKHRIRMLSALLAVIVLAACAVPARAEDARTVDGGLRIENGTLLPMCEYSDPRDPQYSNENSDILRFCVCVRLRSRQIREKQDTSRARITPAAQIQTKTAFRNSLFFFICYRLEGRVVPVSVQALLADILQRIRRYCKNGFCVCLIAAASPGFCARSFPAHGRQSPLFTAFPLPPHCVIVL